MIALVYLGKKAPYTFTCDKFPKEEIVFPGNEEPVWVKKEVGMWLLKLNPLMLVKVDEKGKTGKKSLAANGEGSEIDSADTESRPDPEKLRCPHCFKSYSDQKWYDKHVKKCSGKTEA